MSDTQQQTHSSSHHTLSLPCQYNAQDVSSHTEPMGIQTESNILWLIKIPWLQNEKYSK
jgi:hypothetical protein